MKKTLQLKTKKRILVTFLILVFLAGSIAIITNLINSWTDEIVAEKMKVCSNVLDSLQLSSESYIDSLHEAGVFDRSTLTELIVDKVDSCLKVITNSVLSKVPGTEGGFYSPELEKFLGYDYPTSPLPKPVYGPPPRSFDIIVTQLNECIEKKQLIAEMHQFDPAIFPLTTKPIIYKGEVIGCIWARIHIERDMPSVKIRDFFSSSAIISLLGFILVAFAYIRFRYNLNLLRLDIAKIENNPEYRVKDLPGIFGSIGGYVNKMVASLSTEHHKRQKLELELIQKDKMATLGSLISGVVHEVKTPLAIIKTRIQIWQQEIRKEQLNNNRLLDGESFQMVVDEIDRLTRLVKRLLAFSKSVSPDFQPLNLHDVFRRAASMVLINHDFELKTNFSGNIPLLRGDAGAIEQVFINLLNNAIEAMPMGGVVSAVTFMDAEKKNVIIQIADEGSGVQQGMNLKIFEPFFTTKTNGVGLGLSICKEIIISHNGKIEFLSNSPQGTIVKIILPIKVY